MNRARKGLSILAVLVLVALVLAGAISTANAVDVGDTGSIASGQSVYYGKGYDGNPIEWVALKNAGGQLYLFAEDVLRAAGGGVLYRTITDTQNGPHWNTWNASDLYNWLNTESSGNFIYDAFQYAERTQIATTSYTTEVGTNSEWGGSGIATNDSSKIFLLDLVDVRQGGIAESYLSASNRWWLRSPGLYAHDAAFVDGSGEVASSGTGVNNPDIPLAVRPAFSLNLTSVLFTSAAAGGKSSAVGATLEAALPPTGAVKLTVVDDANLALSCTTTAIGTVEPGATVELAYSGVSTGTGRYVSCVIEDSSGVLYYGTLEDVSIAASGTTSFTVPSGLADGTYTVRLFNEEINGDNYTDFASTPVPLSMTVSNTAPTITAISPTDTDVAITETQLVLTFSETVTKGTGNVTIDDGTNPYTAAVSNATINGTGTSCTATIPLSAFTGLSLAPDTTYTVGVEADAFKDVTSNGIAANTNVGSFTTQGQVATPVANPAGGTYTTAQTVSLSTTTTGAAIYYTTDGRDPSQANGTLYAGPFVAPNGTTLKAIAVAASMVDSAITTEVYTQAGTVAAPVANPAGGTYTTAQTVSLTTTTAGAAIYYTTNGTDPSQTSGTPYASPFEVPNGTTLKAVAVAANMVDSAITTEVYTQAGTVATPVANPAGGIYASPPQVTLTSTTANTSIRYTLDGSDPAMNGTLYTGPITVPLGLTDTALKAIATAANMVDSAMLTATYVLEMPQPEIETLQGGREIPYGGALEIQLRNPGDYAAPLFQWQKDGVSIPGATGDRYSATEAGEYVLLAEDRGQSAGSSPIALTRAEPPALTSLTINGVSATINGTNVLITLPAGTDLTNLSGTTAASNGSTSLGDSFTGLDASGGRFGFRLYDVNGNEFATCTVLITLSPGAAKAITAFAIGGSAGTIDEAARTIAVTVPFGTDVTALTPTIAHTGTSVSPASGTAANFTSPVSYTVKAADNSQAVYTVTVTVAPNPGAPSITPASGTFDRANPQSIAITLDPAGQTCGSLSSDAGGLAENSHYTKLGDVYTLLPAFMAAQTPGNHTVFFHMSGGGTVSFTLTVTDTTPGNLSIGASPAAFDADGGRSTVTVKGDNLDGQAVLVELLDKDRTVVGSATRTGAGDVTLAIPENTSTTEDRGYSIRVTVGGTSKEFANVVTVQAVIAGGAVIAEATQPPEPEIRKLTDPATGVSVEGPMLGETTLRVTTRGVLHAAGCNACDLIRKLQSAGHILALYDIELVPPMDAEYSYTVTLPVGSRHNGSTLSILHCDDGVPDWGKDRVVDGRVRIGVTSHSPFAVLAGEYGVLTAGDVPKTGDDFPIVWLSAALVALMAGAAVLLHRARRLGRERV